MITFPRTRMLIFNFITGCTENGFVHGMKSADSDKLSHICVNILTSIVSDNGLSSDWRQAIIWTNGIFLIGPFGINFSEILIKIHIFSFGKIRLKMWSGKWRPSCPGPNVLKRVKFEHMLHNVFMGTSSDNGLRWMLQCTLDDKSTLVQSVASNIRDELNQPRG